ncbi:MAG TPA: hypothetical protein VMN57_12090 [Anaerolineales bacterium]|nr:hypothetical protein [Anaerolineales bacterium]
MPLPSIVVNAFNRPASLNRLLESLRRADLPDGAGLLISIDGGGDPQVRQIATGFEWPFGDKTVRTHDRNLGLVEHFLRCGALTRELGDLIYLEDDLTVSRQFYHYSRQALEAFRTDDRIAGISLNRLAINGYTHHRFEPLPDRSDAFFAQVYWYQGQAYTPEMWDRFESGYLRDRRPIVPEDGLHPLFLPHPRWKNDFFPDAMRYLHATGRFFAFPRESHTTQFGDPGTHFDHSTDVYQVPLQHHRSDFRFAAPDEAQAVYDTFLEILPDRLAGALPGYTFDVDLNGTKPPAALRAPYTLTIRPVRSAIASFGLKMRPAEQNVIDTVPGGTIRLSAVEDVRFGPFSDLAVAAALDRYHHPNRTGVTRGLLYRVFRALDRGTDR